MPDGDYASLVKSFGPKPRRPATSSTSAAASLGQHRGVVHFTVGQRRGIEIGGQTEPLYVVRIEPETRRLVVGPRRALAVDAMRVEELELDRRGAARGQRQGTLAWRPRSGPRIDGDWVRFDRAEYGVAPGQAAVCYDGIAPARRRLDRRNRGGEGERGRRGLKV